MHLYAAEDARDGSRTKESLVSATPSSSSSSLIEETKSEEQKKSGKRIVFACDGTQYSLEGLRWSLKHLIRAGDVVDLAYVVASERTPATAVGSSSAATQWTVPKDARMGERDFFARLEDESRKMMESLFVPEMSLAPGVEHSVKLLRLRTHKSAASIGEILSEHSRSVNADFLFISSHGAGVQCDFGSVARWCAEKSCVPSLLLPPQILSGESSEASHTAPGCSNTLVVAAIESLDSLREAFKFATEKLGRPQDNVYLILVKSAHSDEIAIDARKELVGAALKWQEELALEFEQAKSFNIAVDLVTDPVNSDEMASMLANGRGSSELVPMSPAGAHLCNLVEGFEARTLVLKRHGYSTPEEIQFGSLISHCLRRCQRPLVLYK